MRRILLVVWCICDVAVANEADLQGKKYAALILPENVTLGMTRDAIQSARPEAKKLDASLVTRRNNAVVLTELKKGVSPATCYQYHFVDNHLRAVTKGILHPGERDDQKMKHIHEVFAKDLVKQMDEKIIRLDANMQQVPVTAELWKDEKNGICVYFVDTSKDTTIITFDPRYFAKRDFFVTADQMPEIAPALETVRRQIEESKKLKK
jgi:hypothetical protein